VSAGVHVVGSANMDRTIPVADAPGPGETVLGGAVTRGPGGKGLNQAVAAARLGARTAFVGAVGDDDDGQVLVATLRDEGIDLEGLTRVDGPSGQAVILLEPDGSNRIVVAPGANDRVVADGLDCRSGDVVVAQLEVPLRAVEATLTRGRAVDAVTLLNAAPARRGLDVLLPLVDVLVVNEPELAALASDRVGHDLVAVAASARRLPTRLGTVITLGHRGALLVTDRDHRHLPAPSVDVVDTTGAGDCFVGALASSLAGPGGLEAACLTAVSAASRSVTAAGAAPSMPTVEELDAWIPEIVPAAGD
jgi:ribokinase